MLWLFFSFFFISPSSVSVTLKLPKLSSSHLSSLSLSQALRTHLSVYRCPSRQSPQPMPSQPPIALAHTVPVPDHLTPSLPSRRSPHRHSPLCRPSSPTHPFYRLSLSTLCLFVIGDFVWSGLRKKIGDLGFFFFFSCCGLVLVVVVAVADGRGGCGCYCECFLCIGIYYFIVVVILFYCDVYIILLC